MIVRCNCEECKHNEDGYCGLNMVYISNSEMTAAGFLAQCTDYDEAEYWAEKEIRNG